MLTEPMSHQKSIFEKTKNLSMFGLSMEWGTGKTYCILNWIEYNQSRLSGKVLVIGKKTNIIEGGIWPEEIRKHTNFSYMILTGNNKRTALFSPLGKHTDLYLINYDSVENMFPDLIKKGFSCIVIDESTKIKNPDAHRTRAVHRLMKNIPYRIIAAGSFVTEDMKEIWSQFRVIDSDYELETTYWKFLIKYFYKWKFGWGIKLGSYDRIMNIVNKNIFYVALKDCMDLPKKIHRFIPVESSKKQMKFMSELKSDFELNFDSETKLTFEYMFPVMMKLRQICSGFIYLPNGSTPHFPTAKDNIILDIVSNTTNAKKIIWCVFREEVFKLREMLEKEKSGVITLTSEQCDKVKKNVLDSFKNDPKINILITTYDLLESGENLTAASYSIHYSLPWSNDVYTNAKRRVYRKGAEQYDRIVYIYIYTKGSIEERILQVLQKKSSFLRHMKSFVKEWMK